MGTGSIFGSKMLIPVYLRGSSYYLHTRVGGKQFKRTLKTSNKSLAIIRASKILGALMEIDLAGLRKFEINLKEGILKADGAEDHARMMEALAMLKGSGFLPAAPSKEEFSARSYTGMSILLPKMLPVPKAKSLVSH